MKWLKWFGIGFLLVLVYMLAGLFLPFAAKLPVPQFARDLKAKLLKK